MIDWLKSQGDIAFLSGAALPTSVQEYKRSGESMVPCDIEIAEDVEGVKIYCSWQQRRQVCCLQASLPFWRDIRLGSGWRHLGGIIPYHRFRLAPVRAEGFRHNSR